jgi:hypothetical protein
MSDREEVAAHNPVETPDCARSAERAALAGS